MNAPTSGGRLKINLLFFSQPIPFPRLPRPAAGAGAA